MDTLILDFFKNASGSVLFLGYFIWNLFVFLLYGLDKAKSKTKSRRISERTLLTCAVLFGGIGALLGMGVFRHKTRHFNFVITVPVCAILNVVVLLWYL